MYLVRKIIGNNKRGKPFDEDTKIQNIQHMIRGIKYRTKRRLLLYYCTTARVYHNTARRLLLVLFCVRTTRRAKHASSAKRYSLSESDCSGQSEARATGDAKNKRDDSLAKLQSDVRCFCARHGIVFSHSGIRSSSNHWSAFQVTKAL